MTAPIDTTFVSGTTITSAWLNGVNDKLKETVSVKDFGAVMDGVTDDTLAYQAALNYISTNHCELLLPPGTLLLNSSYASGYEAIAIGPYCGTIQGKSGFKIRGSGIGVTKVICGNSAVLSHQLFIYNCSNFEISNIEFIGNNAGLVGGQNNGAVMLYGASNFSVNNIKTSIFQGSHFVGDWWWNGEFHNITQSVPTAASGFDVAYLQNIKINNHYAVGSGVSGQGFQCAYDIPGIAANPTGLTLDWGMSNNIRITNSDYSKFATGVYINEARDIWIDGNNFHDNYIASGDYKAGVLFSMYSASVGYNINIANNTFSKNGSGSGTAGYRGGVFLSGTTGSLQVFSENNKYLDNTDSGIFVYNGASVSLQSVGDYFGNTTTSNQTTDIANSPTTIPQKSQGINLATGQLLMNGYDANNGWTAYTPTVTSSAGSITTVAANGFYKVIGKTCLLRVSVGITNNGTGAGLLNVALPIAHKSTGCGSIFNGRETAVTGAVLTGQANLGSSTFGIANTNGTYPAVTGYVLAGSLNYEI